MTRIYAHRDLPQYPDTLCEWAAYPLEGRVIRCIHCGEVAPELPERSPWPAWLERFRAYLAHEEPRGSMIRGRPRPFPPP